MPTGKDNEEAQTTTEKIDIYQEHLYSKDHLNSI